jgi:hypothetical protein
MHYAPTRPRSPRPYSPRLVKGHRPLRSEASSISGERRPQVWRSSPPIPQLCRRGPAFAVFSRPRFDGSAHRGAFASVAKTPGHAPAPPPFERSRTRASRDRDDARRLLQPATRATAEAFAHDATTRGHMPRTVRPRPRSSGRSSASPDREVAQTSGSEPFGSRAEGPCTADDARVSTRSPARTRMGRETRAKVDRRSDDPSSSFSRAPVSPERATEGLENPSAARTGHDERCATATPRGPPVRSPSGAAPRRAASFETIEVLSAASEPDHARELAPPPRSDRASRHAAQPSRILRALLEEAAPL